MSKDVKKGLIFGFGISIVCGIGQIIGRVFSMNFVGSLGIMIISGVIGGVLIGLLLKSIDKKVR